MTLSRRTIAPALRRVAFALTATAALLSACRPAVETAAGPGATLPARVAAFGIRAHVSASMQALRPISARRMRLLMVPILEEYF